MPTRRLFLAGLPAALAACAAAPAPLPEAPAEPPPPPPPLPAFYGAVADEPYPVPAVPEGVVDPALWRQEVENPFPGHAPGTIVVDPDAANLHLLEPGGRATRYGVSVGRDGFAWNGAAVMQWKQEWPRWKVPDSMIERQPELAPWSWKRGGMPPGPGNPLGARALYLFQDGEDTLYRIHGGCEPALLGQAVSSGCIRLLDQDIIDLYGRVQPGAPVIVLPSVRQTRPGGLY